MKAVMLMFDSLNRRMLEPYGCDWVKTPNFSRLARRCATFERNFAGSLPCIPARRELQTGRYNFLHNTWGPMEPFDDSMPEMLKKAGIYTHLVSDHLHYWEEGGATYHTKYSTWEIVRGQEGDPWIPCPDERPEFPGEERWRMQDRVNRRAMSAEPDMPMPQVFARGIDFLERFHNSDNWFLQIETFDPHEPYFSPERYKALYPHSYDGPFIDCPPYARVTEDAEFIEHIRCQSAALHSMCNHYLGALLDVFDRLNLWEDTMLIINTDHGFLLGEHNWWAKSMMPCYDEIAHTPLFIWDPRCAAANVRRQALTSAVDLAPTVLAAFGLSASKDMEGADLAPVVANDTPIHDGVLFGIFANEVSVTDGRYVYMRGGRITQDTPVYEYTLMPLDMTAPIPTEKLSRAELAPPFSFTKGCPVLKIPSGVWQGCSPECLDTALFDLETDPGELHPLHDAETEARMKALMKKLMEQNDAPKEQFARLGL